MIAHRRVPYLVAACALIAASACKRDRGGPIPAESIALTASATSIGVGQTATLYVHASDAAGTRIPKFSAVTWASSNPTVASVAKSDTTGIVTGVAVGEAVISATVRSGLVAQILVRVGVIPVILATPSAASFTGYRGSVVNPQSIVISNAGAGALSALSASTTATWLQATFVDGITTANPTATLRLQPTIGSLANGTYSSTVTVSSGMQGVGSRTIPVTFQVAAGPTAFKIEAVTPPSQSGSAGKPVAQPPAVIVRAADNTPVPGVSVTFAVGGGGTIVPSGVVTTDANGVAALTSWTLGSQPGSSQTVTATSPGLAGSPLTFTATALAASKIVKVSGDGQSGVLGGPLPEPLVVRVTDPNDTPVPNATVTFTTGTGNGAVAPATATTDANGQATGIWTLGTALGPQAATAALVGPPGAPFVTFSASGRGITIVDGDNQTGRASTALPRQVVARVVSTIGTGVPGVTVTFTPATGSGQSFSPTSGTTDANGDVRTTWTLGSALTTYTATVSSPGLASRVITATANQLSPNVGVFTGGAAKVPGGAAPSAGDQAVLAYSGPASGEVALGAGGTFTTPSLQPGTYTLSIVSKSGAFPTTNVYGASLLGGQVTSVGTIPIAFPGTGAVRVAVHACTQVGDANGTATVRLYSGINGDIAGGPAYSWSIPFGNLNTQTSVAYGIYTMTITTQAVDPTKNCAVFRTQVVHSFTANDGTTTVPLIILNNP